MRWGGLIVLFVVTAFISIQSKANLRGYNTSESLTDTGSYKIISHGGDAGEYQAFPDATRLKNGDIIVVFYSGDSHVTKATAKYPKAGRICIVRSVDEGKTWSTPVTLYDDSTDNRDAHISQLKNGTIICTFFNLVIDSAKVKHGEVRMVKSTNNGYTWDKSSQLIAKDWFCSAQVKELKDGSLLQSVYTIVDNKTNSTRIGFVRSENKGISWSSVSKVGWDSVYTVNETDIITLKDGSLYAAVRGNFKEQIPMHFTQSNDLGKSWLPLKSIGFYGDAPSFTRLSSGEILLSTRGYYNKEKTGPAYTALHISNDECKTWQGPYLVDKSPGAYPSTVELKDKTILVVFYQEGEGSAIGVIRFKKPSLIANKLFTEPLQIEKLPL
jgi:hypothetical protein